MLRGSSYEGWCVLICKCLGRLCWLSSSGLPCPTLCGSYWLLFSGVWSLGVRIRTLGDPGASTASVVGSVGSWRPWDCCLPTGGWCLFLGLVPDSWQAEGWPWSLGGRAQGSQSLFQTICVFVGGSSHSLVWDLECLEACIGLLVGRARAHLVPG